MDRFPAVPLLAWQPHLAAGLLVVAGLLAAAPSTRAAAAVVGVVALGLGAFAAARRRPLRRPDPAAGDLVVLVLNVWHGRADTAALAALVERAAPDLVVLPEAGHDYCAKLLPLVEVLGFRGMSTTGPGTPDGWGVVMLAGPRADLVGLERGHAMRLPHLRATGGLLGDRALYAVHATAPARLGTVYRWRADLRAATAWTADGALVAGDLNATVDHRLLRAAGRSAGPVGHGTWPTRLPRWAGIRIDHVLLPDGVVAVAASVHDVPGSDHRAVVARLRLAAR